MAGESFDNLMRLAEEAQRGAAPGSAEATPTAGSATGKGFFRRGLDKLTGGGKAVAGGIGGGEAAGRIGEGGEALFDEMGNALEARKVSGRSVADFALRGGATGALRFGTRELAKNVVAQIGLAAAVGGGVVGTAAAGAFVGAVAGAVVEYARQVNKNLDQRLAGVQEADPAVVGRKKALLRKMRELRQTEVLKPNDYRKIGKAAVFGGVAGAGAGALVEFVPWFSEFGSRYFGGVRSAFSGAKEAVGNLQVSLPSEAPIVEGAKNLASGAKEVGGGIGQGIGNVVGNIRQGVDLGGAQQAGQEAAKAAAGETAQGAGQAVEQAAQGVGQAGGEAAAQGAGQAAGEAAQGAGQAAGEVAQGAGEAAQGVGQVAQEGAQQGAAGQVAGEVAVPGAPQAQAPEGFVPKAEADALKEQVADLQRQLEDVNKGVAPTGGAVGVVAGAAGAAAAQEAAEQAVQAHAQSVLDSFGGSIPLSPGSNPWEVSTTILKQMGVTNPSPGQIMQLDKILCQENNIGVPEWGIPGIHDAHNLQPFNPSDSSGIKFNLTDAVKKTALELATKK